MMDTNDIYIYQTETGSLELKIDSSVDTIWANLDQISKLFDKDKSVISRHIRNIYKEQELDKSSTIAFFAKVQKEGNRLVKRRIEYFNLDVILSVGYRTNSKKATKFRKWATSVLKDHLLKGYTLNQKLLQQNQHQIQEIQKTLEFLVKNAKSLDVSDAFIEILHAYTTSLIALHQFDENRLPVCPTRKDTRIEINELRNIIQQTKENLLAKGEATGLFAQEYEGKFESVIGTIYQTFDGKELYPTLEEKSSHLFYLIIKNHCFVDGNKRIASILFVYYLAKHAFLYRSNGEPKIHDYTLVALAILIAQSNPKDKDILIKLLIYFIQEPLSSLGG